MNRLLAAFAALVLAVPTPGFAAGERAEPRGLRSQAPHETLRPAETGAEIDPKVWVEDAVDIPLGPTTLRGAEAPPLRLIESRPKPLGDLQREPVAVKLVVTAEGLAKLDEALAGDHRRVSLETLSRFWGERVAPHPDFDAPLSPADPNAPLAAAIERLRGPNFAADLLDPPRPSAHERALRRDVLGRLDAAKYDRSDAAQRDVALAIVARLGSLGVAAEPAIFHDPKEPQSAYAVRVIPPEPSKRPPHWIARLAGFLEETNHGLFIEPGLADDGIAGTQGLRGISLLPSAIESPAPTDEAEHELGHHLMRLGERLDRGDNVWSARARTRVDLKPPERYRFSLRSFDERWLAALREAAERSSYVQERMNEILNRTGAWRQRQPDPAGFIERQLRHYAERYPIEETWTYWLSARRHLDAARIFDAAHSERGRRVDGARLRRSAYLALSRSLYGLGIVETTERLVQMDIEELGKAVAHMRVSNLFTDGEWRGPHFSANFAALSRARGETAADKAALSAVAEEATALLTRSRRSAD